ncbi:hypothetical protein GCM10011581_45040 [Saccharopolyspora subtropica]|uniref:Uncharacterized protein n=1 Tax=Saccharopolyspora thermophila TaxID=89367 RepID=A0A917K8Q6_9PSEU|nr:hypothetical protein GCM10011581_45040 [Saccharopolyspora subtropica]
MMEARFDAFGVAWRITRAFGQGSVVDYARNPVEVVACLTDNRPDNRR